MQNTHFKKKARVIVPLTESQLTFALSVSDCITLDNVDFSEPTPTGTAKLLPKDIYKAAKHFVKSLGDDYEPFKANLGFNIQGSYGEQPHLLLKNEAGFDPRHIANFIHCILKTLKADDTVAFHVTHVRDCDVFAEFGGEAYYVTKYNVKHMSTQSWLDSMAS